MHPERRLGVVAGAVRVLERDAEARRDLAEGARALALLELARPDERVDPLDVPPQRRRSLGDRPRAQSRSPRKARSKAALYAAGNAARRARHDLRGDGLEAGASFTSSSVMLWTSLASSGMGRPGLTSQFLRSTISPPRARRDADLDDAIDRGVAPGGLDVDERDGQLVPRRVCGELLEQPARDGASRCAMPG